MLQRISVILSFLLFLSCLNLYAESVDCDVVVVGGGSAGMVAATQSARAGAKTILVEAGFQLGGTATSGGVNFPGLFHAWGKQVIGGIGWEMVEKTARLNDDPLPDFSVPTGRQHWRHQLRLNIPLYAVIAEEICLEAGVEIRYFEAPMTVVALKKTENDGLNWQLITVSQGEQRTIRCKQLVDCTGNGQLCDLVGAKRMREEITQPGTFEYTIHANMDVTEAEKNVEDIRKRYREAVERGDVRPEDFRHGIMAVIKGRCANYIYGADNSTGKLRSETNIQARQSMLRALRFIRSLPGGEKAKLVSMSPEVGIRETWRVKGRYVMTEEDYRTGKIWEDSVAYAFYPIDMHVNESGVKPSHLAEGVVATIPLRILLPEGVDNLLVAGRCVSSDRGANSALRVQATCMSGGQAAGAAAALASKKGIAPHELNIEELKQLLREHQAIVPEKKN